MGRISYNSDMRNFLSNQTPNKFLWTPFLMAAGAAGITCGNYVLAIIMTIVLATTITAGTLGRTYLRNAGLFIIFGALYAIGYTHILATPAIPRDMRDVEITGTVRHIDYTPDKTRIFIQIPADQIKAGDGTAMVRANISDGAPRIGDTISATASLFAPAGADAPEAFDYARWAYFNGLSATGYITEVNITSHSNAGRIGRLRDRLHVAANSFLADGLVLGYKNTLSTEERDIWTTVGIGHVWSISGFHMTLVAGWLFAIFFGIFRLIPYVTRRVPARIPATICAWAGLASYLMLSGGGVATMRAFLMTSLVFGALIIGRNALSMRNIAIVFCALFLINPHYVMQPGFQLSFSAVFGLIWFWGGRTAKAPTTRMGKIKFAIYAAIMTSVVATIFTAPFVAAHFYEMPTYGLVGNLVLLPIFSVAIMPLTLIGVIAAAFGWNGVLNLATQIYEIARAIAEHIAAWPGANIAMPHIPNAAMLAFITGFVCLMLIRPDEHARKYISRHINYFICMVFLATGVMITALRTRPVFYATRDHELVGFVYDGKLEFNKARASRHRFAFDTWRQFNNEAPADVNTRRKCDNGVCIYQGRNFSVAYIQKYVPLQKNIVQLCRDDKIDYIVSYFDVRGPRCDHKILRGGFVIYPSGQVRHINQSRPWHNPRR